LRKAVDGDGTAYRVGGDEFCVLLSCRPEHFDEVTRRIAEALTAKGKGFAVSAAWGIARIPSEAAGPGEALRLADVRMYAQKESRRMAEPTEGPVVTSAPEKI
jgi:two-component system, cell cycle response regulator